MGTVYMTMTCMSMFKSTFAMMMTGVLCVPLSASTVCMMSKERMGRWRERGGEHSAGVHYRGVFPLPIFLVACRHITASERDSPSFLKHVSTIFFGVIKGCKCDNFKCAR